MFIDERDRTDLYIPLRALMAEIALLHSISKLDF